MNKLVVTMSALAGLATVGTAGAADLPMKAPPYVPPVVYSWTGCYIGAGGGYGMWNQDVYAETLPPLPTIALTTTTTTGGRGWFGTGQVGCDYQVSPSFVFGAFVDGSVSNIHGNVQAFNLLIPISADEKQSSSWAVGGRVGYVVFPKLLTFVSGGWTQARFDQMNFQSTIIGLPLPPGISITAPATNYNGWFIGGGTEYGFDFMPGLFWKTEYRYSSYKAQDLALSINGVVLPVGFNSQKFEQVVRTELVWRFNFGGPVVARY
jgi:outer membrane immunogenic protein